MKIDRLIGILSILLQEEKVTASYLADIFEVSRRTINRDVEALLRAGIPLATFQGQHGGISIMPAYRIDRTVLTSSEMQSILTGLRSLDSVAGTSRYQQLMKKLSADQASVQVPESHIMINLSSWHKSSLSPKIELIQEAIEAGRSIKFYYYAPRGETERIIDPYLLIFQWSSWYVRGYCRDRKDFRMFKLNRIQELADTGEHYEKLPLPPFECVPENPYPISFKVTAVCEPEVKWRLVEEFGIGCFKEREDGTLLFEAGFSDRENLFGWLLSMGDQIELMEPEELRKDMEELALGIYEKYAGKRKSMLLATGPKEGYNKT
ncbi:helix-turn-helix transcriptional regulator [Lacrimispora brassicae]